ncbi:MAG: recombinase family protein [Cypionkella sp.]|uniref:recombinase family protein n=1 Tax=Cypionkella sp. TaxID=2811411 RepID=UPI0026242DC7|nr:recombinase family protein [Cypionkella sp.]MDB5658025.1 recombinase family protein [Cypionkella sp.]
MIYIANIKTKIPAFAYLRTSSATNVGEAKDSDKRQSLAIAAFARARGYVIVETFYDAAVSGTDPIETRPGMLALLDAVLANGTHTILVESPDRFARDAIVQELGHRLLKERGIDLIPTTAPDYFTVDTPTTQLVRTILGAFSAFERMTLNAKLKGARDRNSAALGRRVEGRKPVDDIIIADAKRLYRRNPKTGKRRSLRDIAAALPLQASGKPYNQGSIIQMLIRAGVYEPKAVTP